MNTSHTVLLHHIRQKISLSETEIDTLINAFVPVTKSKQAYLLHQGAAAQYLFFICSGYVRMGYEEAKGNEVTTGLYTTHDFVTSFESFMKTTPSKEHVQCLSDCQLLMISKEAHEHLYTTISGWAVFCQQVYEHHILQMHERIHTLQNLSASERYARLVQRRPEIVLHTSVKHLASYLGIQPQSLSRIRKTIK